MRGLPIKLGQICEAIVAETEHQKSTTAALQSYVLQAGRRAHNVSIR